MRPGGKPAFLGGPGLDCCCCCWVPGVIAVAAFGGLGLFIEGPVAPELKLGGRCMPPGCDVNLLLGAVFAGTHPVVEGGLTRIFPGLGALQLGVIGRVSVFVI